MPDDAPVDTVRPTWDQVLGRAALVFLATWVLFYLAGWNAGSPIYTDSDGVLLVLAVAWVGVGVVLLAARRRSWGLGWLLGSTSFFVAYVVLIVLLVFAYGS